MNHRHHTRKLPCYVQPSSCPPSWWKSWHRVVRFSEPGGGKNTFLPLWWKHVGEYFTFVLQRVAGSYFHRSAYGFSRTVNNLVVGKSDVKFLKLSHRCAALRSAPLLGRCASRRRCCSLSPAAASSLPTSDVTSTARRKWINIVLCGLYGLLCNSIA